MLAPSKTIFAALSLCGLVIASSCRSSDGMSEGPAIGAPAIAAEVGPPAPPEDLNSAGVTIAARARQDLLESLALDQSLTPSTSSVGLPGRSESTVTWQTPEASASESPAKDLPTITVDSPPVNPPPAPPTIDALHQKLASALYERSRRGETPMRDLTVLAALTMLDGERTVQPEILESLDSDERIALAALQEWFLSLEDQMENPDAVLETLSEAVVGLQASLRQSPTFGLTESRLVTRVGGYGDIDEWTLRTTSNHYNFIAHAGQEIILYLELEGFDSRLEDDGNWSTATSQELTIYSDRDGIPVWKEAWRTANDQAASRRQDYFTVQKMKIPTNLSVGKYLLKVRVRDEHSRSESETNIPFVMTAAAIAP